MKEFMSLRLLDKFSFIFKKLDIDYEIMRKILKLKLTMDNRRVPTIMDKSENDKEKENNSFKKSLIIYALMGLIIMIVVMTEMPLFPKMNFSIGMIMFMVITTLISDFSSVLLDVKDRSILMTKPINSKTINMARMIHIFIYLFSITMAIAGPTLIVGTIKYGVLFPIILFIELIFILMFIIVITTLLYLAILNFFDGEKLKDIINYFQIILSITITVAYQFIGDMFKIFGSNIVFKPKWWTYFMPTAWFSSTFELIINNNFEKHFIYLSILSLLIPVVFFMIHIKFVIPYFERKLLKLSDSSANKDKFIEKKAKLHKIMSDFICFNKIENTFFRFTQNMLSNERKLKLSIYPSIGFSIVLPFIIIFRGFNNFKSISNISTEIYNGKLYLSIYLTVLTLASITTMIKGCENYKGAWIYKVLPVENPKYVYKGAFKAVLLKYSMPSFLFTSLIFLSLCGFKIGIDLILIFLNMILLNLLIFQGMSKDFPFSKEFSVAQNDDKLASAMISIGVCGVCAGLHMILKTMRYGIVVYIPILLIFVILLWKRTFKVDNINSSEL